ncbi:MAG TPA: hypothetical protein PKV48_00275 [Thermodesulfobacteriota bacterium]|nr:hypothetical protein [Thermodesulfobacteriota bacterium]
MKNTNESIDNYQDYLDELTHAEDILLTTAITKQTRSVLKKEEETEVLIGVNTYTIPNTIMLLQQDKLFR